MALVASVALSLAAIFAQQQAVGTEQNLHHLRLRSLLSVRESLARIVLSQAHLYPCTAPSPVLDYTSCAPKIDEIRSRVELAVPGCVLASGSLGPLCGIVVDLDPTQTFFDTATGTMHLRLIYNGQDASLGAMGTTVELALDTLVAKGKQISCTLDANNPKPFFAGLDKTGAAICEGFGGGTCPEHAYIRSLKKGTKNFEIVCKPLLASPVGCGFEKYVESYNWNGDDSYSVDCQDFRDPFSVWPAL